MKRVLCVLSLACMLIVSASLAQAAPVDVWNVSITSKFTNLVMSDGTVIADGGNYFTWDNGSNFLGLDATSEGQMTRGYEDQYSPYFTGGLSRNTDAVNPALVELKSADISFEITLTPEGGSDSVNFTIDLPLHYYNVTFWGEQRGGIVINVNSEFMTKQIVYDGIAYEFGVSWLPMYDYWHWDNNMDPVDAANLREYFGWGPDDVFYCYTLAPSFNPIYLSGGARGPAVPVPAAVWLMGTGLAGLAALKRSKRG